MERFTFTIQEIELFFWPTKEIIEKSLKKWNTSPQEIKDFLFGKQLDKNKKNKGFQIELAENLRKLLDDHFRSKNNVTMCTDHRYIPTMNEKADLVIGHKEFSKKIFVEIEFRPNEHKDLIKFLIGHKHQMLELGILIVTIERKAINPNYSTMPEYKKVVKTIEALQPDCPVMVIGIDGQFK